MKPLAPRRSLSPHLLRRALASNINQAVLARHAGWPCYAQFYTALRSPIIIATPLAVDRLMRLADLLEFRRDQVFLDEPLPQRGSPGAAIATSPAEAV